MLLEDYKRPEGLSRYSIKSNGCVWDSKTASFVNTYRNCNSLATVTLVNDRGFEESHEVCGLVARTFLPNPEHLANLDHIDGNPFNDDLENLRWACHCKRGYRFSTPRPRLPIPSLTDDATWFPS